MATRCTSSSMAARAIRSSFSTVIIRIVEYDREWTARAQAELRRLREALGPWRDAWST